MVGRLVGCGVDVRFRWRFDHSSHGPRLDDLPAEAGSASSWSATIHPCRRSRNGNRASSSSRRHGGHVAFRIRTPPRRCPVHPSHSRRWIAAAVWSCPGVRSGRRAFGAFLRRARSLPSARCRRAAAGRTLSGLPTTITVVPDQLEPFRSRPPAGMMVVSSFPRLRRDRQRFGDGQCATPDGL